MTKPFLVLFTVTLLFFVVYFVVRATRMRSKERLHCASKDADVEVEFLRKLDPMWGPGDRVDVIRCSAFENPEAIACAKDCLVQPSKQSSSGDRAPKR